MQTGSEFSRALLHPRFWLLWLAMGLWWLVAQLPFGILRSLGFATGALLYRIGGSRRRIVERNIALCFPELSAAEQQQRAKDNFANYGLALFEVAIAWWWRDKRLDRLVNVSGLEHIENLQGQGALLLSMHFTSLELGAQALARKVAIDGMYRRHGNAVYEYLQSRGRESRADGRVFERKDVRGVARALREGRIIWYAPDQDYGSKQSLFAPFFGIPAASVTATAKFARIGNARVIPFTCFRRADNSGYDVEIHPPLENFPSDDEWVDVSRVNAIVEGFVRQHPEQYLWAHRRFKTRPPGEPSLYT
jgi:KDO2-lipid IV(A) lauroyltransferase